MRRMAWGGIFLAAISMIGCGGGDDAPATSTTNASNAKPAGGGGPVVQPPGGGGGNAPAVGPPPGGNAPAVGAPPGGGSPMAGGPPGPGGQSPGPGGGSPNPLGGGSPNPIGGVPGSSGFGSPPPGVGGPPGGFGGSPGGIGGIGGAPAAAPVGGTPPNYLGLASALGSAANTAPLSFYEKAMLCFQQGKDEEAFRYLYADAVTGSVKSKSLNMKWSAALKRPVAAIRFGVAVNYNKPANYNGSPLAIGTKFNEQGQPQGTTGMGGPGMMAPPGGPGPGGAGGQQTDPAPTDPVANFEYYTGDFGKKVMVKLNEGIRDGDFGAFYKEAVDFKPPTQPQLNLASFMGGPPPSAVGGPGAGYGAPGGGYGAPPGGFGGGGSPNPLGGGGGLPPGPGPATGGGGGLPAAPGPATGGGGGPGAGEAGVGSNLKTVPGNSLNGRQHILAQQQDDGLSAGSPGVGQGAAGSPGPGIPGMGQGMGPGGMFGQQQNNAPKPVAGVKYYGSGTQADIIEKAKADGVDILLFFTVKVEPPNRRGIGADNTTSCRAINVHDGSSLFEGSKGITAKKASEKPEAVDAAVDGLFTWFNEGATGAKGPIGKLVVDDKLPEGINSDTVKGRVIKLSTAGGEGLEVMQRLAELRFYNARRLVPLNDLKAAYEAILGAEKGAKLAMGSTSDKRAVIDAWNAKYEPTLTSAPAPAAGAGNNFGGGSPYGAPGGIGGPPAGVGGPPPGYGPPGGGFGGPGSPGPPGAPGTGGGGLPGSSAPGSPPPGSGGPPGSPLSPPGGGGPPGNNPGFPGGKGSGS